MGDAQSDRRAWPSSPPPPPSSPTSAADAAAGRPAPPPAAGAPAAAPAAVQADVTRKARPAVAQTDSRRGTGLRADDAATPPSPETAPAMSASSHLGRTTGGAHAAAPAMPGRESATGLTTTSASAQAARGPVARAPRLPLIHFLLLSRGHSPRHRQEVPVVGYDFGVGREAPTFTLSAVDGSEIKLNQYRGDWFPVLVFIPTQTPARSRGAGAAEQGCGHPVGTARPAGRRLRRRPRRVRDPCGAGPRPGVPAAAGRRQRRPGCTARSARTAPSAPWPSSSTAPARSSGPARARRRSRRQAARRLPRRRPLTARSGRRGRVALRPPAPPFPQLRSIPAHAGTTGYAVSVKE